MSPSLLSFHLNGDNDSKKGLIGYGLMEMQKIDSKTYIQLIMLRKLLVTDYKLAEMRGSEANDPFVVEGN